MKIRETIKSLLKKKALTVILIFSGLAIGMGIYTFVYARGYSYLSDSPGVCANCHIMNEQYDGWIKGSHHGVAVCNDCHTPEGFIGKYFTKALNGYNHSYAFTTGDFHEPVRINDRNREITENACRKCHGEFVEMAEHASSEKISCLRCHSSAGH